MGEDDEPSYISLDSQGRRQGHLLSLNGYTQVYGGSASANPLAGQRYIDTKFMDITIAAFLAWYDFQNRRPQVLPHLPHLLEDCDFQMTFEVRDPKFSRAEAIRQALQATERSSPTHPFAVVGPLFASVTKTVNTLLGGGMGVAQISGQVSSDSLVNAPLFSRTIPTNKVHARATMAYLHQLGVTRAANLYYVDDELGIELHHDLQDAAKDFGITFLHFGIQRNEHSPTRSIRETLGNLRASQAKYVVAVLEDVDYKRVVRAAHQEVMMGLGQDEFAWFMVGFADWADFTFGLSAMRDAEVAKALHGVGMIHLYLNQNSAYNVFQKRFEQSTALQQEFLSHVREPEAFQNYTFEATSQLQQFQYFTYDAVIAMGLAACKATGFFTGSQLHDNMKGVEFEGVSGHVYFDQQGVRSADDFVLHVNNILLSDDRSTASQYRFDAQLVAVVKGDNITLKNAFVFSSNSTIMPPVYPTLQDYDYNLIPTVLQVVGLCMGGFVVVLSLGFMGWTYWNRTRFVVSAAQPIFLAMLCMGTIAMALCIVPFSMQGTESTPQLDAACMVIPWAFFLGLCLAISAILCKTWRLEQILESANGMRRCQIEAADVIKPFVILLVWNVIMLMGWTVVSPQHYVRLPVDDFDQYGRNKASIGVCHAESDWAWLFRGFIIAADFIAIVIVGQKCYKVRNKSSFFAETKSLAWSVASLVETSAVFAPLLIASKDNPSAYYAASTGLVSITCLCFLLPIFLFKIHHSHAVYNDAKEEEKMQEALHALAVSGMDGSEHHSMDGSHRSTGRMTIVRVDRDSQYSHTITNHQISSTFSHAGNRVGSRKDLSSRVSFAPSTLSRIDSHNSQNRKHSCFYGRSFA